LRKTPILPRYNGSAEKIFNTTSSLARFESKNIFSAFKKRGSLLGTYSAGVVVVNSYVVGLAPGPMPFDPSAISVWSRKGFEFEHVQQKCLNRSLQLGTKYYQSNAMKYHEK
jgi:hypothetical protein